ncbi:GNAT family N-acetyltransferase [Inquilinus limosus]|uniref:GNAT family N-acetyltransferase n=1 Tax=Inquilinus limosus TaxID=171674 RepID=UPI0004001E10|nr:GNAT family N-acetyltransferase [Inquilinus limosus]
MAIELRALHPEDHARIAAVGGGAAWNADPALWAGYLADQAAGRRAVLLACDGGRPVGYGTLVWDSDYPPFRAAAVPEVNNLVVAAPARGRGIGSALIRAFEDLARAAGRRQIGLGVGLYADYGPAQRLYAGLGYRPDGRGVTWREQPVEPGAPVPVDDDLVLWLIKPL